VTLPPNNSDSQAPQTPSDNGHCNPLPGIVSDLNTLVKLGVKFPTIYADPPWPYSNRAARGAAEKHYRTLSMDAIRAEPIRDLAADQAHLHLWTTNAFLHEAFDVIRAWGFRYKSCLIWIKPQLGMGNYWRVSHEYLLLGVRGGLLFRDRTCRSWLLARRSVHSRKPFAFRALVEQVSPGPYLELYGREEHPSTDWTIYGNQVERRLF
jgi:N6-adenosine-specific RNA methylase IME4